MSSDGGFSAPSTAPTFAACSAASANSDSGNNIYAMPAVQNGVLGSPGTANSSDGNENPFAVEVAAGAGGPGDATGATEASGFEAMPTQIWGMGQTGGITENTKSEIPEPKSPRVARQSAASPAPSSSQVVGRYRKVSPRSPRHDLE